MFSLDRHIYRRADPLIFQAGLVPRCSFRHLFGLIGCFLWPLPETKKRVNAALLITYILDEECYNGIE
jgi:hypothetical protein